MSDIKAIKKDILDTKKIPGWKFLGGAGDILVIFLKKTKYAIAKLLNIILRKSLDKRKIPGTLQSANITLIYKWEIKIKWENYHIVSLVSHLSKLFEGVMV